MPIKARRPKIHPKSSTNDILAGEGFRPDKRETEKDEEGGQVDTEGLAYEDPRDSVDIDKLRDIIDNNDISGGYIRLLRKGPTDVDYLYVAKIRVEDFDIDNIKKVYGGGAYKVWTHRADGKKYRLFEFGIDARMMGAMDDTTIRARALPTPSSNPEPSKSTLDTLLRIMPQQQDNTPLLMKVMENSAAKSDQMMMLMVTMMTKSQEAQASNLTAMMGAMAQLAGKNSGGDGGTAAIVPVLIEMIKSKESGKSAVSSLAETVGVVKEIKNLMEGKSEDDEEKEESMFDKLIKLGAPLLANVMAARAGMTGPPPGPGVSVGPAPVPVPPRLRDGAQVANANGTAPPTAAPSPAVSDENRAIIGLFMGQLLKAAQRGSDPAIYADLVLDTLNDQQFGELSGVLADEDWQAKLFGNDPRIVAQQAWFEELRNILLTAEIDNGADENGKGRRDDGSEEAPDVSAPVVGIKTKPIMPSVSKISPTDVSNGSASEQSNSG